MVAVLDKKKKPLMPCSEKRARLLLARGRARGDRFFPFFTIRLVDREMASSTFQPIEVSIDPGSRKTGVAVSRRAGKTRHALVLVEVEHKGQLIKERLQQRKGYRRQRRTHLRYRAPRFLNRTRPEGWLPISTAQGRFSCKSCCEALQVIPCYGSFPGTGPL